MITQEGHVVPAQLAFFDQIKKKKAFEKYQGKGKKIYLFGVEFIDKNVGKWVVEKTF